MNQFFKFFSASCLGTFVALLMIVIFFVGYGGIMASQKPSVSKKTVLKLKFDGSIPEKTGNVPKTSAFSMPDEAIGLRHTKRLIENAATDEKISGILIESASVSTGMATLKSLRSSIEKFKESGKFVYAYADFMSQSGYYLASTADSVFLHPQGMIDMKGFGTMIPFFTKMLEDIGVEMEVFYAGDFKSATEPFRRNEMSPENELQTKEFLNSMLDLYQVQVAESRSMTVDEIDNIMTTYGGRTAKKAKENGLIDAIAYRDELESAIRSKLDLDEDKKIKFKTLSDYNNSVTLKNGTSKNKVAIIYAEGNVNYGTEGNGEINETNHLRFINKVKNDDKVKAVVLRVNSGGGSSLTSDIIWRGLEKVKEAGKPVIASFGDYAASGGYYIAAGADTIVSEPNTLTGSIGVFAMLPNVSDLFEDKLSIYFDTVKTHDMAIGINPFLDLSKSEEIYLKESVDDIYDTFLSRVADGRNMSKDEVHKIAQGRVWTGEKGKEIGLVDVLGDLETAIAIAAEKAGVADDYKVVEYPFIKESFMDKLVKGLAESESAQAYISPAISKKEQALINHVKKASTVFLDRSVQARIPFEIKID